VGDYSWAHNAISVSGGQTVAQFNGENPMHPLLNTLTTLFLEQNFIKEYQKDFVRMDFKTSQENEHFELKASIEYALRSHYKISKRLLRIAGSIGNGGNLLPISLDNARSRPTQPCCPYLCRSTRR
jgi:hypothetical protein